ncbi:barstar family protein [Solirubrum puertoriconensis]|uniref:Barstar (barnase inhibitor) domain-containing protein n=1 Tax=Solirubrum puertoriconensis TaxID=1751427 RepID=A0A9X0L6C4_SOLP1|nr:barstar family protein [Solirubrum puertoriconensis]KUG09591.1 hypothetical protein ASU33_17970 [Solirubrum puertoriconensis]
MIIDLSGITNEAAIHQLFKEKLDFPEWYGENWDAFWDSIVAVVELPEHLNIINWEDFARHCPRDMQILQRLIQDYNIAMTPKHIELGLAVA